MHSFPLACQIIYNFNLTLAYIYHPCLCKTVYPHMHTHTRMHPLMHAYTLYTYLMCVSSYKVSHGLWWNKCWCLYTCIHRYVHLTQLFVAENKESKTVHAVKHCPFLFHSWFSFLIGNIVFTESDLDMSFGSSSFETDTEWVLLNMQISALPVIYIYCIEVLLSYCNKWIRVWRLLKEQVNGWLLWSDRGITHYQYPGSTIIPLPPSYSPKNCWYSSDFNVGRISLLGEFCF